MVLRQISDVIATRSGLSYKVLDYCQLMEHMVDAAKEPGFGPECWAPLTDLVDTAAFERVGNFKEVMNWSDYVAFLTRWATSSEWACSFKRMTEQGNLVFLELEERSETQGIKNVVNSLTVYEFNPSGRICHLDVYLQMPLPSADMLGSYEGVRISG